MNAVRLSICMPTYNYGSYIGRAIDSVLEQIEPGVEIVVLDGGSSDQTRSEVDARAARYGCVRYIYQETRGGIDRDMARTVELAQGEFCWLLSADDALLPGGLRKILSAFGSGRRLLLTNRWWCDADLRPLRRDKWLDMPVGDADFDFTNPKQLRTYFERARSLGALFSFMSSIGFERAAWLQSYSDDALAGSNYAHIQRLFEIGFRGAKLAYLAEPLVYCRGGSDSFRSGGLISRLLIDLRGLMILSNVLFPGNAELQQAFRAVLKREHPPRRWIRACGTLADPTAWGEVDSLLAVYGYPAWQRAGIRASGRVLRQFQKPSASVA